MRDLAILDIRDVEVQEALGVTQTDLVRGRGRCQAIARRARQLGADGMVVPSAARDAGWNLVVFPRGFAALAPAGSSLRTPAPPPDR